MTDAKWPDHIDVWVGEQCEHYFPRNDCEGAFTEGYLLGINEYADGQSNWARLFGTPERAAKTATALITCRVVGCSDCMARGLCRPTSCFDTSEEAIAEWLREVGE